MGRPFIFFKAPARDSSHTSPMCDSLLPSQNKTVGIIGAGRIGAAYARMMVEGHKMNLIYYDPYPNVKLEQYIKMYGELLRHQGEAPVAVKRVDTVEEVLKEADVSLSLVYSRL